MGETTSKIEREEGVSSSTINAPVTTPKAQDESTSKESHIRYNPISSLQSRLEKTKGSVTSGEETKRAKRKKESPVNSESCPLTGVNDAMKSYHAKIGKSKRRKLHSVIVDNSLRCGDLQAVENAEPASPLQEKQKVDETGIPNSANPMTLYPFAVKTHAIQKDQRQSRPQNAEAKAVLVEFERVDLEESMSRVSKVTSHEKKRETSNPQRRKKNSGSSMNISDGRNDSSPNLTIATPHTPNSLRKRSSSLSIDSLIRNTPGLAASRYEDKQLQLPDHPLDDVDSDAEDVSRFLRQYSDGGLGSGLEEDAGPDIVDDKGQFRLPIVNEPLGCAQEGRENESPTPTSRNAGARHQTISKNSGPQQVFFDGQWPSPDERTLETPKPLKPDAADFIPTSGQPQSKSVYQNLGFSTAKPPSTARKLKRITRLQPNPEAQQKSCKFPEMDNSLLSYSTARSSTKKRRLPELQVSPLNAPPKRRKSEVRPKATPRTKTASTRTPKTKTPKPQIPRNVALPPDVVQIRLFRDTYCAEHEISEQQFLALVHGNARQDKNLRKFWEEVYEVLSDRVHTAAQKFCRRQFRDGKRGGWTAADDDQLRQAVALKGKNWKAIGEICDRFYEDCRDRWRNYIFKSEERKTTAWTPLEEMGLRRAVGDCMYSMYQAQLAELDIERKGRIDFKAADAGKLINWQVVSDRMGNTRGRLQCNEKWNRLKGAGTADYGTEFRRAVHRSNHWENSKRMLTGDWYDMLEAISLQDAATEAEIKWDDVGKSQDWRKRWSSSELQKGWADLKVETGGEERRNEDLGKKWHKFVRKSRKWLAKERTDRLEERWNVVLEEDAPAVMAPPEDTPVVDEPAGEVVNGPEGRSMDGPAANPEEEEEEEVDDRPLKGNNASSIDERELENDEEAMDVQNRPVVIDAHEDRVSAVESGDDESSESDAQDIKQDAGMDMAKFPAASDAGESEDGDESPVAREYTESDSDAESDTDAEDVETDTKIDAVKSSYALEAGESEDSSVQSDHEQPPNVKREQEEPDDPMALDDDDVVKLEAAESVQADVDEIEDDEEDEAYKQWLAEIGDAI